MASAEGTHERPGFEDLIGADSQRHSLAALAGQRATVLVFTSNGCPTARSYENRLIGLQRRWHADGVRLVAINSNNPHLSPADTPEEMARRAALRGFNFPYLKDADGAVARSYGAICTPHAVVLDSALTIAYSGRIDDSRTGTTIRNRDLERPWRTSSPDARWRSRVRSRSAAASSGKHRRSVSATVAAGSAKEETASDRRHDPRLRRRRKTAAGRDRWRAPGRQAGCRDSASATTTPCRALRTTPWPDSAPPGSSSASNWSPPLGGASSTAQELTMATDTTYVIVGASLAGAEAAETLGTECLHCAGERGCLVFVIHSCLPPGICRANREVAAAGA